MSELYEEVLATPRLMNGQMSRLDQAHVLLCAMNFRHRPLWKPACVLPMPGAHEFPFRSRRLLFATIHLALKQFRTICTTEH